MELKVFNESDQLLPKYETTMSAGMDVRADLKNKGFDELMKFGNVEADYFGNDYNEYNIVLKPGGRIAVPTGLYVEIPFGYEIQVRPRSGLALKNGITVCNTPGTIDSDWRGIIGVILINHGSEDFVIRHGDRIAQLILNKVENIQWKVVDKLSDLSETKRGDGGFGSTGKK
jgi:dUTP pyrophosphatase